MKTETYEDFNPIVHAHNLAVRYGERLIWSDASFEIDQGEFVAILGPNGSGKSTLIKLLLGLKKQSEGSVRMFGRVPTKGNPRIGYVSQRRPIDREMNIAAIELVKLGLNGNKWGVQSSKQSKKDEAIALTILDIVDAKNLAYQPLGILSGGELQRVFLAQALVGKPKLLLLDEPLANLDISHEANLVKLISRIVRKQNISVMLIAHNLNPLLPYLDKVIYVANEKVSSGIPEEIINSKSLSDLYGSPIEVLRDSKGRIAVLGVEESAHHHA